MIAEALNNSALLYVCGSVSNIQNQTFRLSSKYLTRLYKETHNSLKKFNLIVNDQSFFINFSLFSCVSDKLFNLGNNEGHFQVHLPDEVFPCFAAFFKVFDGYPFIWKKISLSSVIHLIEVFSLSPLYLLLSESISLPKSLIGALEFPTNDDFVFTEKFFNHSISWIIEIFESLPIDKLHLLSNQHLEALLHSQGLHYRNEDFLL